MRHCLVMQEAFNANPFWMQVCVGFYQTLCVGSEGVHVVIRAGKAGMVAVVTWDSLMLVVRGGEFLKRGLHAPDLTSVLGDGAITGELATSGNVVDHLLGPFLGVLM